LFWEWEWEWEWLYPYLPISSSPRGILRKGREIYVVTEGRPDKPSSLFKPLTDNRIVLLW